MEDTELRPWSQRPLVRGVIVVAGLFAITGTAYQFWPESQPSATPREQFVETFQIADQTDKDNWNRMWREAGKKPPPAR